MSVSDQVKTYHVAAALAQNPQPSIDSEARRGPPLKGSWVTSKAARWGLGSQILVRRDVHRRQELLRIVKLCSDAEID
jgi:hypothetical protein